MVQKYRQTVGISCQEKKYTLPFHHLFFTFNLSGIPVVVYSDLTKTFDLGDCEILLKNLDAWLGLYIFQAGDQQEEK